MRIDVRIISGDCELGFDLVGGRSFPRMRPVMVPGEATISSQSLTAVDYTMGCDEIIDLGIDIDEKTEVATFANWLFEKLTTRASAIRSLVLTPKPKLTLKL